MLSALHKVFLLTVCIFGFFNQNGFSKCYKDPFLIAAAAEGRIATLDYASVVDNIDLHEICDTDRGSISLLHIAAESGNERTLRFLIEEGFKINDRNNDYQLPPLHFAISRRNTETARYLKKNGAELAYLNPQIASIYQNFISEQFDCYFDLAEGAGLIKYNY